MLVSTYDNAVNKSVFHAFKFMVDCQDPCEITCSINDNPPVEFLIRMINETRDHPVH